LTELVNCCVNNKGSVLLTS